MENFNLVMGVHSIVAALENPKRNIYKLVGTEDALDDLKKLVNTDNITYEMVSSHKVQEEAKGYFRDLKLEYQRVPSGVFLLCSELEIYDSAFLYKEIADRSNLKILCLDQISDVHNAAAILRTASFYGVDYVIVPDKKSFGLTPSFFRIASGAAEYVPLIGVNKLTKTITKLKSENIMCLALSEHADGDLSTKEISNFPKGLCLILGKEDVGISNAVLRLVDFKISLDSVGGIKSLNVAAAAAITMEKCFSQS
jgi:23S rRNA (guanosine2251-2'-O)-methyltransferase